MEVLDASPRDWPEIWPFFEQVVAEGETYTYPTDITAADAELAWFDGAQRVVVARDGGQVVGTARMGPNRPGHGDHVATASFMVDPAARSRGVGALLGADMIAWARAAGYSGIAFNSVVASNTAAVRLWERLGFRIVGTVPGAFRSPSLGRVGLHVMYLDLTEGAP